MIKIETLELPELEADDVRNEYKQYDSESSDFRYQMADDYDLGIESQGLGGTVTDLERYIDWTYTMNVCKSPLAYIFSEGFGGEPYSPGQEEYIEYMSGGIGGCLYWDTHGVDEFNVGVTFKQITAFFHIDNSGDCGSENIVEYSDFFLLMLLPNS